MNEAHRKVISEATVFSELPLELQPPDPDSPRGRILAAARDLFADLGFEGASIRAIAEKAGVNLAMVNYYYGCKCKLYERVLVHEFLQFRGPSVQYAHEGKSPGQAILELPFHIMKLLKDNPVRSTLIRREVASGGEYMGRALKSLESYGPLGFAQLFNQAYAAAVDEKELREMPADPLRECMIALAYGMFFMQPFFRVIFQRDLTDETVWKEVTETLGSLLRHGLLVEKK